MTDCFPSEVVNVIFLFFHAYQVAREIGFECVVGPVRGVSEVVGVIVFRPLHRVLRLVDQSFLELQNKPKLEKLLLARLVHS